MDLGFIMRASGSGIPCFKDLQRRLCSADRHWHCYYIATALNASLLTVDQKGPNYSFSQTIFSSVKQHRRPFDSSSCIITSVLIVWRLVEVTDGLEVAFTFIFPAPKGRINSLDLQQLLSTWGFRTTRHRRSVGCQRLRSLLEMTDQERRYEGRLDSRIFKILIGVRIKTN